LINSFVRIKRRWRRRFSRTRLVARLLQRDVSPPPSDDPGLVLLQIDGLARKQFEAAVASGRMPNLARLVKREHFDLETFYSGLPATTPAVQGEIMFGARTAVPAFQFLHRETGRTFTMFESECAKIVGARLEAEHQPLLEGGRSYSNIFAGGASEARFCAETMDLKTWREMATPAKLAIVLGLYFFTILRIAALALLEVLIAIGDVVVGLAGRHHWQAETRMIVSRTLVGIVGREWIRAMVKISIAEGAPIIHANFLGYDEQAHRRGPDSDYAHWGLKGIDNVIGDIFPTARATEARDYEVVVFSDHGQQRTDIYELKQGYTVQEAVRRVFLTGTLAGRNVFDLGFPGGRGGAMEQRSRRMMRVNRGRTDAPQPTAEQLANEIVVTALGPLGHIYAPVKLSDEDKGEYARRLVTEEHIPLVIYREADGTVRARSGRGAWTLPQDIASIYGPDHPFIQEGAVDLVRLCEHPDAGDLVISGWDPATEPVSFVQENGAHASIGVDETRAFALLPHSFRIRRRRTAAGETYLRGEDLYRAAWRFIHPGRPLTHHHAPSDAHGDHRWRPHWESRNGKGQDESLRVMTYNIHSCIGLDGKVRPERIAQVIRSCGADVVALQEVDAFRARSRRHDQARMIAESLSMSHHYYAVADWGNEQYGLAVISRYPLEHMQSGHLTAADHKRRTEARGALWVTLQAPWGPMQLINTHFGLRREERLRQVNLLLGSDWLGGIPDDQPVILCGDLNDGPKSQVYKALTGRLVDAQTHLANYRPRATFISTMPVRRLDHIFFSPHFTVENVLLPKSPTAKIASDHLPVCAELHLAATAPLRR